MYLHNLVFVAGSSSELLKTLHVKAAMLLFSKSLEGILNMSSIHRSVSISIDLDSNKGWGEEDNRNNISNCADNRGIKDQSQSPGITHHELVCWLLPPCIVSA